MILASHIGDSITFSIPMRWGNRPFVPAGLFNIIFTLKADPDADADAAAKFQKQLGAGIVVVGNRASVSILPINTAGGTVGEEEIPSLLANTYYWDIQAQSLDDPTDVRTVATGTYHLLRQVTIETGASMVIYTATPADLFPFTEIDGGTPESTYEGVNALDEGAP